MVLIGVELLSDFIFVPCFVHSSSHGERVPKVLMGQSVVRVKANSEPVFFFGSCPVPILRLCLCDFCVRFRRSGVQFKSLRSRRLHDCEVLAGWPPDTVMCFCYSDVGRREIGSGMDHVLEELLSFP